ncbi:MAG: hypothetical protein EBX41_01070 [Chitinophagia bacterium]|nr:hypothetical protein [Chitinophagia bacterium]
MRYSTLLLLFLVATLSTSWAQTKKNGQLKGLLIDNVSKMPIFDTKVALPDDGISIISDGGGAFYFDNLTPGKHKLSVGNTHTWDTTVDVPAGILDLGEIQLSKAKLDTSHDAPIYTVSMADNATNAQDDGSSGGQSSGGFFSATQDPFFYTASFVFGMYRFRPRGLANGPEVLINGFPIQDLETGYSSWNQIGGLNDVFRGRNVTYGLKPSDYTYGNTGGATYIDATAADQRKGTSISYSASNGLYNNRLMLTHSSGIMKNGWAYSFSASRRWAQEAYEQGTYYDGYSIYAGASKMLKKGSINLTAVYAPTERGRSAAVVDELYRLSGSNYYNPSWGYQNGKKRNGNISDTKQPIIMLNHVFKPNEKLSINTTLGMEFGTNSRTGIDFYNGYSPYPDYYRNLPSYYLTFTTPNYVAAAAVEEQLKNHPEQLQIDWDGMVAANRINKEVIRNVDGTGLSDSGNRSIYVVSSRVDKMSKFVFNTNIQKIQSEKTTLFGGIRFVRQQDQYYTQLNDLLGGDFFVNYNQFAAQTYIGNPTYNQNDLNNPNKLIKVGDKYGNDYKFTIMESSAWAQMVHNTNNLDMFGAIELGSTSFFRTGLMRNGLFPENSYGQSGIHSFFFYSAKAGLTYKINARNAFFVSASFSTEPPKAINTYISAPTRDFIIENPTTQKMLATEIGYSYKTTNFSCKALAYIYEGKDGTLKTRFFNDDPTIQSFVNYVMTNVGTRSLGTEVSGNYKLNKLISLTGVISVGQSFYSNRPDVGVYTDNDPTMKYTTREVYIKNYYLGNGPQSIYSFAVNYRPRSWRTALIFNYQDRNFVGINPDRRTQASADLVTPGTDQWNKIYNQERLPSAFTIDVNGGRSFDVNHYWRSLKHKTSLYFNFGVRNLLNNTNIKVTGYEQLRFDYSGKNADRFPNKYDYAFGLNYYANISLRF